MTRRPVPLLVLIALAVALAGCTLQTAGAPTGERTYQARFDDVQHLVVGHSVRISDVVVGTVTGVSLDGYDAVVDMSIVDGREIPAGTTASVSSTSLLGESYVRLRLPEDGAGAPLPDGAELATTQADASFEELTLQLLTLTRAVQGRDVATVVDAGAQALSGRGDDLNGLLDSAAQISAELADQRQQFEALIDHAGELGGAMAPEAVEIAETIDLAAEATGELARQRDRLVQTVAAVTDVASTIEVEVLAPHRAQIDQLLADVSPVVAAVNADVGTLIETLEALITFNENIPRATGGGVLLSYAIFDEYLLGDRSLQTTELGHLIHTLLNPNPDDPGQTVGDAVGSATRTVEELLGVLGGGAG